MKKFKKFLSISVVFLHVFTQALPVSFAEGEALPPVINLQENTATAFGDIVIPEGQTLAVNIINALGEVCPSCRAIMEGNSFINMGTFDITGFLALIAPIIINEGSITTTGGLILSNLGIDQQAFYNGMAELSKSGLNPTDSFILNKGEIDAMTGKIIALIGANGGVHNFGSIRAEGGAIAMIAGDKVSFPLTRDGVLDVSVEGLTGLKGQVFDSKGNPVETDGVITSSGLLSANGGFVLLSAAARETMLDQMINITGTVEAKSLQEKDGEIILSGDQGDVAISGNLNSSAAESGARGGKINITGGDIEILDGARIEALGYGMDSNGGSIFVMGQGTSTLNAGSLLDVSAGTRGDGGFIEFSAKTNVELAGGVMLAEAQDGNAGEILIDPANLTISTNQFTGGANVTYQADETITVNPGVIISSRVVSGGAGGDHLNGASTGNSGNITFEASNITIGSGAKILAQGTGAFTGGDITMTATDNAVTVTPLINYNDANAKITINNATIKGDDIFIKARAEAGRTFSDGDDPLEWGIGLLNVTGGPATLFGGGIAVAYSDAQIEVNSGSNISGTSVTLWADARSDATVTLLGGEGVMVGYAETDTTAKVNVNGATINAGNLVTILAKTDAKTEANVIVANLGTRGQAPLAVTFAGADATMTTEAKVDGSSTITAGNTIDVHAEAHKFQNANASGGAYTDGVLGVAVAISESDTTTTASLDGTVTSTGNDVKVRADMDASKNDVAAAAAAGSGLVAGIVVGGMNGAINGVFSSKKPSTSKDPQAQPIGLSAGFALSEHKNDLKAEIADGAVVKANTNVLVEASVKEVPETSAIATVDTANMTNDTKKNVAISAAVVIGSFENNAEARIGAANVDAKGDIDVHAKSSYPYQIQWDQISGVSDVLDKINPNLGVQNGLFTSWAQSQATGEDVGVAGSVNILTLDNSAKAYIDENANVNQDTNYRTGSQDVKVRAESDIETLNISGNFGLNPVSTGGQKGGIGVAYLEVNYLNDVYAGVKTGAKVTAESLDVTSDVKTKNISIAESGGKGGQYGFNGAFSFQGVDNTTVAQVDDGATIVTFDDSGSGNESLLVSAKDDAKLLNIAGGISKGGNVGIGTSVSLNQFDRVTEALIGNNDGETDSATGSVSSDSDILVQAENTGLLESYSLAAAFVMPDANTPSAGNFGIGISGDVSLNKMDDFAYAYIDDSDIKKATDVTVKAKNDSEMNAVSGAVAFVSVGGTSAGLAGSYSNNDIRSQSKAYIENSSVDASGNLEVNASTLSDMLVIGASGSGNSAGGYAIAGTTSINDIDSDTYAYINTSDIKNADLVTVKALDDSTIQANAGSLGIGGKSSSGGSTSNNKVETFVQAYSADSDINADDKILFDASNTGNVEVYAAALGGATAGTGSSSVSSDNEVQQNTTAGVKGKKSLGVRSDSDITIKAVNDADVFLGGGNLSLSGQSGHGRVIGINDIEADTSVYADGARLDSKGKIDMQAKMTGTIQTVTVGGTVASGQSLAAGWSDNNIENLVSAKIISDSDVDATGDITLLASDESDIDTLAGVVAGGGKNSIGGVIAQNTIDNIIRTSIDDSFVTTTGGKISLNSTSNASIDALSASGAFGGQSGLNGAVSLNTINNEIESSIKAKSDVDASGKVEVKAQDTSNIRSLAGALTLTGSNSLGGSAATNDIANAMLAVIDDSTVDSTGNSVELTATETATIDTISAGGAFSGSNSISGAISLNDIDNNTTAAIKNNSTVTGNQNVNVTATDTATIKSLSGQVGGAGSNALAGAVSTNDISDITKAYGEDSTITATNGNVEARATNSSTIETTAVAGGGAGTAAIAGSVAINTIGTDTQAYLKGTTTTADDSIVVVAKSNDTITTRSGTLAVGGTAGVGGSVVLNTLNKTTKAYTDNSVNKSSTIKAKGNGSALIPKADGNAGTDQINGLAVVAESTDDVDTYAATLSGGGTGAINATVTVNHADNDTQAYIQNTSVNPASPNAAQTVKVRAFSNTDIMMRGGGLAAGGAAGVGASVDTSMITNITKAFIKGSTVNAENNGIEVRSISDEKIDSLIVSGGIGGSAGVAGSVAVLDIDSSNEAYVENSVLNSKGDLKVTADDDAEIDAIAGSLTIGGVAGAGASVIVANIANDITARITDSTTNAKGTTEVNADSNSNITDYTASGTLGGYAGVGGAIIVNTIGNTTQAYMNEVTGNTAVNQDNNFGSSTQDVKVIAKDNSVLNAKAGNLSGGSTVGVGASIDLGTIKNTTTASIGNNTQVAADRDVQVKAESTKDVDSVTVAAAGGGLAGVAGSVSLINIGSALSSQGGTAASSTSSTANNAISSNNATSRAGSSTAATNASTQIGGKTGNLGTSDEFNQSASVTQTTTASIGNSAVVDAGGDITVDADDNTDVDVLAGTIAVGGLGVGGAVSLVNIRPRTNATVGSSADLSAGDDVTVDAKGTITQSDVTSVAGTVGSISLGAAYTKIVSDNDVTASIGNSAIVRKADQVQVLGENSTDVRAKSYGANVGAAAVGVSLADASETGSVQASLGSNVKIADTANSKTVNDLLVQAKAGNYVQAYTVAAAGGIISGQGSVANTLADSDTTATIGSGSDIHAENDITVKSYSRNHADSDSFGVSVGALTVGVSKAYAETSPNVTASVADSVSGSGAKLNAKRDVNIIADSDENALAYAQSAAGGVISGNGSDADSNTSPAVKAFLGNNNEVDAGRDALIKAYSITYSVAQAAGISAGGLAVAASLADAVTNAVVQAYTGHNSKVRATRNANVVSTFNVFADGTYLDDRTKADSNASAGALVGVTGTKSTVSSTANTGAWISTGSLLKGGNDSKIQTIANNATYANALGKAGGLLAGGYTGTSASLTTNAEAIVYGTGTVEAGHDAVVSAQAVSDSYSKAEGGAGQDISGALSALFTGNFSASDIPSIATFAGTSGSTTVNTLANTRTETGSTVKGGHDATVSSNAVSKVNADAYMSSTGVFVADAVAGTDVFVDSDSYTTVGGKVEAQNVRITAQNNIDVTAKAQADVHADIAAAFGTAVTRVNIGSSGDPAEAKVTLTSTSDILGTVSVVISALNFQQLGNLLSKAVVKAYGTFTATASTLADGTAYVNSKIQQDAGSKVTTADLAATSLTTYAMDRVPESTADTIVSRVIEVVREVVHEVCEWFPWPLDDLCETVTDFVIDLVTVFDFSVENAKTAGSGLVLSDNINMNGSITGIGGQNRQVTVDANGNIVGGTGSVQGNDVILDDITNNAVSKFRFNADKGTITGNAVIHLKKVISAAIENNSALNLVLNKLDLVSNNNGEPDVVYNSTNTTRYTIDSTIEPVTLTVNNKGAGDVVFNKAVNNYLADFTVTNTGGDILAKDNNVVFQFGGAHLRADNGSLGTASQRLNFRLLRADKLPDGTANPNPAELDAFSYDDMYLSVTGVNTLISTQNCAACTAFTFDPNYVVNNIKLDEINTFGKADILLNKGTLIDYKRVAHDNLATQYDIDNITANEDVILGGAGTTMNVTGAIQSGLKDIDYTIDGSNTYNHELSDNGNLVVLKDVANGGGKIQLTGSLKGTGTLKALDGYSRFNLSNTTSKDVQLGVLDLDDRVNKSITLGSDTNVANLEYDQVKVETFGYGSSGVDINSTQSNADVTIIGTVGNSTGTTTVNAVGSVFQGANGLIKALDIVINAGLGVGTASAFILTDLQGGKLDVTAGGDVFINETSGNMNLGLVTTSDDVTLVAQGAIVDASNDGFGENFGGNVDITADSASLIAGSGIGTSTNGLELRLSNFSGANTDGVLAADGGNGGVFVANESTVGKGLTIGTLGTNSGVSGKGGVVVRSGSPLTVNSDVDDTAGGDITLVADGATAADKLTINANVTATGGNGNITLSAGDTVSLNNNKTVSAAGNGNIKMFGGEDFADGIQDQDGNTGANGGKIVLADGTRVIAANGTITADAADDIAVSSLETANNTNGAITVTSRAGKITDSGDAHTDFITGATGRAVLTAAEGIGSGNALDTSIGKLDAVNNGLNNIEIHQVSGALGIDRVEQQGDGEAKVITDNGTLTVNANQSGVTAKAGKVTLSSLGVNQGLNINDDVTTTGGEIEALSAGNLFMADGTVANAGSGMIDFFSVGDTTLSSLQTTSNAADAITINSLAGVVDGGDANINAITGANGQLNITAQSGIGSTNAIETSTGNLNVTNSNFNDVNITEVASGGDLGINKVDQQSNFGGEVKIITENGNLTLNANQSGVSSKAGKVILEANGTGKDLILNDDVTTTGGEIEMLATRDIIQADGTVANAGSGIIDLDAGRDIAVASLQTSNNGNDAINLNAGGAVIDNGDANVNLATGSLGQLVINASTGVGSGNAIETSVGHLDVVNNGFNDIDITEVASGGDLGINRLDQQGDGNASAKTTAGSLTVNPGQFGVSAKAGLITLFADAFTVGGQQHDLNINDEVRNTTGDIHLYSSSRDINFSAEGDVTSQSGDFDIQAFNKVTMADGAIANAGSGIINVLGLNHVTLSSLQTTSDAQNAVTVFSGGEVIDGGDADLDVITGTGGWLNVTATLGIGDGNALETSTGNLNLTNTFFGDIEIDEVASGENLGIQKIDQQGNGDVEVTTANGDLTVNAGGSGVTAKAGEIILTANGSGEDDNLIVRAGITNTTGDIHLTSTSQGAFFSAQGDVTTDDGHITVDAPENITQEDGNIIKSGTGTIHMTAGENIALGSVQSGSTATDAVLLTAQTGEVSDNGDTDFDIVAQNGTTTIRADKGIGSADELDTMMFDFSAVTDTGNVLIDNTGALNIVTANGVSGVSITDNADNNGNFDIGIITHSPLTVTQGSPVLNMSGGSIGLFAGGDQPGDDLTLLADVETHDGSGDIALSAGDTVFIDAGVDVSADNDGDIAVVSGDDLTDGDLDQDGNTGVGGGDVVMGGTARILSESGNIGVDAADDFFVGVVNADSDADDVRGDVDIRTRAGSVLDSNGPDMNITADELTIDSAGSIGISGDPIEMTVNSINAISTGSMFFFNVGSIAANLISRQGSIELQATGDIVSRGVHAANGTVKLQSGGSILSATGSGVAVSANTVITLIANGTIGAAGTPVSVNLQNPQTVFVSAEGATSENVSINVTGNISPAGFSILNLPPQLVFLNGVAVGGAAINILNSGISSALYGFSLPQNDQTRGVDFPGLFNMESFMYDPAQDIDLSGLEGVSMPEAVTPPVVVPVPEETTLPSAKTVEVSEEKEKKEKQQLEDDNPPAVVPVPADAKPSDAEIVEPISSEDL